MPDASPRATVVVVNWNGAHLLPACLAALAAQTEPAEVVVVENASSDDSLAVLSRFPWVRVVRNAENRGFAGGNNSALHDVTTPFAVLLNNDATPEPDWLAHLLAPFDAPGAQRLAAVTSKVVFAPRFLRLALSTTGFTPGAHDPRTLGLKLAAVAVDGEDVTRRVLAERLTYGREPGFAWTRPSGELLVPVPDGDGPWTVCLRWAAEATKDATLSWDGGSTTATLATDWTEHAAVIAAAPVDVLNNAGSLVFRAGYGADRGFQEVDEGQYDSPQDVFAVCGCAVAFRTQAGRSVGWFDEDFFLYYEDTDLSWRLRLAGWRLRYEPSAVVRHVHAASSVAWSPTFVFHTSRNRLLMLVKDATAARARREYGAFLGETLQMARPVVGALRRGRRPAPGPLPARARAVGSLVRLTPAALRRRREIGRAAVVRRDALETELVSSR